MKEFVKPVLQKKIFSAKDILTASSEAEETCNPPVNPPVVPVTPPDDFEDSHS